MSSPTVPDTVPEPSFAARPPTLWWALRRAALGLAILLAVTGLGAWLLYASIDPDEASAGPAAQGEYAAPRN
jgi:hypothetical protein